MATIAMKSVVYFSATRTFIAIGQWQPWTHGSPPETSVQSASVAQVLSKSLAGIEHAPPASARPTPTPPSQGTSKVPPAASESDPPAFETPPVFAVDMRPPVSRAVMEESTWLPHAMDAKAERRAAPLVRRPKLGDLRPRIPAQVTAQPTSEQASARPSAGSKRNARFSHALWRSAKTPEVPVRGTFARAGKWFRPCLFAQSDKSRLGAPHSRQANPFSRIHVALRRPRVEHT